MNGAKIAKLQEVFPKHIAVLHIESGEKRLASVRMGAWMFMNLGDVAWILNQQAK